MQKNLPLINSSHGSETRNIINELIKLFNGMGYTYDEALQKAHDVLNEAKKTNRLNNNTNDRLDKIIADSGTSSTEVVDARGNHTVLRGRLNDIEENKARKINFEVSDYIQVPNVFPNPNWQINRDAFQSANDDAFSNGGGSVTAPPGEYLIKDLIQDSHVELYLPNVTFKNPDGFSNVLSARRNETTGNIRNTDTGWVTSSEVVVEDVGNIEVGSVVIVHHAGGILDSQFSALSSDINSSTTSISMDQNNGRFPSSGYMQVGNELIKYTSISGTSLVGVERGALGTTKSTHSAGDYIGVARHLYAEVADVKGNTLSINVEPDVNLTNTKIEYGSVRPSIKGLKVDANKVAGGHHASVYGISWGSVGHGRMEDVEVINGDMGGVFLGSGTANSYINNIHLHDCGVVDSSSPKGAGLWLFSGAKHNKINNISVTGDAWASVYIDDRTTISSPYDAPADDNFITNFVFDTVYPGVGYPPSFSIVGSNRNKFINGYSSGAVTGVEISPGGQYQSATGKNEATANDNEIVGVHFDAQQPWIIRGKGNRVHESTYSEIASSLPIVEEGNLVYAVSTSPGGTINSLMDVKFGNGTASRPGISFLNAPNTGFYRDGSSPIRVAIEGQLKYSFFGTELRFADGVAITTGSGAGTKIGLTSNQKIGFYGSTPIAQPDRIPSLPADATTAQMRDWIQTIIITLRNLGLTG